MSPEELVAQVPGQRPLRRHQLCNQPAADRRAAGGELRGAHQEHRPAAGAGGDLR